MKKTIFSKFIATLMTGAVLISTTVLGTGFTASAATTGPTISIPDSYVYAGQILEAPINITNNTQGISSLGLVISYDSSLEYVDFTKGSNDYWVVYEESDTGPHVIIAAINLTNKTGDMKVGTLKFRVPDNANINDTFSFNINVDDISNLQGISMNNFIVDNGIKITKLLGDVNFDGVVNAVDASKVQQHYLSVMQSGHGELDDKIEIADVNKDGKVNAVDASKILQYYNAKMGNPNATWADVL